MTPGARLAIGTVIVLGATAYMAYVGASTSWQYYLTVDECLSQSTELTGRPLRINGTIRRDSLVIRPNRLGAEFQLEGTNGSIRVEFIGRVPDNLAESRQVVVEGHLDNDHRLHAETVLTRCSSKYVSQPDADASNVSMSGTIE
jgi:cytochrome c-type biogenesis protein CcmE